MGSLTTEKSCGKTARSVVFLSLSLDFVRHRFHTLWTKISDIRRIDDVIKPCYAINNEHKFEHFMTGGET